MEKLSSFMLLAQIVIAPMVGMPAQAQTNFPQVMPAETLYGNTNPQSGPGFAVPLAQLASTLSLLSPATVTFAANASALAAASIPSTVNYISTESAGCSLNYTKGGTSPVSPWGAVLNVTSGIYWEPIFEQSPVRGCQFGTVADGTYNSSTGAVAGTDNTAIIQAAINYAIQNKYETVCLNDGNFRTTDTLHLGWGDRFYTISLVSCNGGRNAVMCGSAGACILPTATDRCAINVQGTRYTGIRGLSLVGQNTSYFFSGSFPSVWPSSAAGWLNPTLAVVGTNPGGLQRYAAYSGICIDAYSGEPPSAIGSNAQYPFVTNYPTFTGLSTATASISSASPAVLTWPGSSFTSTDGSSIFTGIIFTSGSLPAGFSLNTIYYLRNASGSTYNLSSTPGGALINNAGAAASGLTASRQFGLNASSDVLVEDSDIEGFAILVNSRPGAVVDQNGDFVKLNRVSLTNAPYGVSIGNAQSRSVDLNNINYAFMFAILTNNQFGLQTGQLGGPLKNISGGQSYQLFEIGNLSDGAPITIEDIYAEALVRIGTFSGGSPNNSVSINGCNLHFAPQGFSNLVPVAYIEAPAGKVTFNLTDCSFSQGNRIEQLVHGAASVVMNGGSITNGNVGLPFLNLPGIPVAFNYTGGLLISGTANGFPATNGQFVDWLGPTAAFRMTSQTAFSNQLLQKSADFGTYGVRAPFTQATRSFVDSLNQRKYEIAWAPLPGTVNLSSGAVTGTPAAISSCDILTFTYLAAQQAAASQAVNINTGDILYWAGDGTFFVVTQVAALSGGAYPITARQMNNMTINPANTACATNLINDPTLAGNTTIIHVAGTNYADVAPIGAGTPGNIMIPQRVYFGNFVKGSTAVSSVSLTGAGGNGTGFDTYMIANDLIWNYTFNDPNLRWPYASGNKLSTVTAGSPGSATLSAAALRTGSFPILPLPVVGIGVSALESGFRYSAAGTALPTCNAATNGEQLYVSDATAPTYHGAYTSGGAVVAGVVCINGTGWLTN